MPELPEVETVRRGLHQLYLGRPLLGLVLEGHRTVRRHPPGLLRQLEGRVLEGTDRVGKFLFLRWSGGRDLVVHLRMSGQLRAEQRGAQRRPHTHAVMAFDGAGEVHFVDPRTFGELFLLDEARPEGLGHLGPDALRLSAGHLARALDGRRAPLKALLTDQRVVAGVGNIYADEICFAARVRPDRPAGSLSRPAVARLVAGTTDVLARAIEAGGSTLGDGQYCDLFGQPGSFQLQHAVYGREGLPCRSCARPVARVRLGARSSYFCPRCQR